MRSHLARESTAAFSVREEGLILGSAFAVYKELLNFKLSAAAPDFFWAFAVEALPSCGLLRLLHTE